MILIITKQTKDFSMLPDALQIQDVVHFIDDFHIEYQEKTIEFDYLICDNIDLLKSLQKTNILLDPDPVCNFFGQTSLEHIYVGDLDVAVDHLINGD